MSSKIVLNIVKICATLMILVMIFAGVVYVSRSSYEFSYRIFTEPAMASEGNGAEVTIQISKNMSSSDIAELMERKGLSRSAKLFWVQLQMSDYRNSIKPGMYTLRTDMTADQIFAVLGADEDEEK